MGWRDCISKEACLHGPPSYDDEYNMNEHISLYQLMPDQTLLPAQSYLFSIIFVDYLIQDCHPSQFRLVLLSVVAFSELSDLPWRFYDGIVAGVSLALAGI